jgi:hypothetical protein
MFENGVQRKIFGSKRYDVTGDWRRLHKGELYAMYCSPKIILLLNSEIIRWAGHVACMGKEERCIEGGMWR